MNMQSEQTVIIPLCEPFLGGREREYVDDCLKTGWVSSVGKYVESFESRFAERHPGSGAVAVGTGTAAIHLALLAVGVEPNDEVLVSSMTFIAPANAIRYVGAWPVFIEADPDYWQMDVAKVEEFLRYRCEKRSGGLFNRFTGRRVTAVLPVHILGHPVDMDALDAVASQYGLKIIEDATESLGASVRSRSVGTIGHVGCFSFNGNKLMTTGGGGMVISRDPGICSKVRYLSTQAKEPGNEYIHHSVGYNYRLTNIQAAIGCAQLEQLDGFLEKKRTLAQRYSEALHGISGIQLQQEASWATSAHWLFTILVNGEDFGSTARSLIDLMRHNGITTRPLWEPVHLSQAHRNAPAASCPVAEILFEQGISLPSSVGIQKDEQEKVISVITTANAF
jgi:perosamine synthetase